MISQPFDATANAERTPRKIFSPASDHNIANARACKLMCAGNRAPWCTAVEYSTKAGGRCELYGKDQTPTRVRASSPALPILSSPTGMFLVRLRAPPPAPLHAVCQVDVVTRTYVRFTPVSLFLLAAVGLGAFDAGL